MSGVEIRYLLDDIIFELTVLSEHLSRYKILDPLGKDALQAQIMYLEEIRNKKRSKKIQSKTSWKITIEPSHPILFKICEVDGYRLQVDIFCFVSYPESTIQDWNETITIRIWSDDERLFFRKSLDSINIEKRINKFGINRRVMARFHFDRANPGQAGPRFHLQIGGKQHEDEYCWYPKVLEVPRFIHHPMNLMLACEFVIANFFSEKYDKISNEVTWHRALKRCQEEYLIPYFKTNLKNWDNEESLLKYLWNNYETLCS